MPSAKELRDELRSLRKEAVKPVSKMRVGDISSEIERLKSAREDTPAVAATPIERTPKKMGAKISDMKEAKAKEFPTAPMAEKKPEKSEKKSEKKGGVVVGGSGAIGETTKMEKKKSKLEKLMAMLESDSE
jgi:hypothetical protein